MCIRDRSDCPQLCRIEVGQYSFYHFKSFVLKNNPSLSNIQLDDNVSKGCETIIFEGTDDEWFITRSSTTVFNNTGWESSLRKLGIYKRGIQTVPCCTDNGEYEYCMIDHSDLPSLTRFIGKGSNFIQVGSVTLASTSRNGLWFRCLREKTLQNLFSQF